MSDEKRTRVSVDLKDFLRVVVVERSSYDSPAKAASALGMTEGSFTQRLTRERKNYPAIFESVPKYTGNRGPRRPSESEALELLASLQETSEDSEDGEDSENA